MRRLVMRALWGFGRSMVEMGENYGVFLVCQR